MLPVMQLGSAESEGELEGVLERVTDGEPVPVGDTGLKVPVLLFEGGRPGVTDALPVWEELGVSLAVGVCEGAR